VSPAAVDLLNLIPTESASLPAAAPPRPAGGDGPSFEEHLARAGRQTRDDTGGTTATGTSTRSQQPADRDTDDHADDSSAGSERSSTQEPTAVQSGRKPKSSDEKDHENEDGGKQNDAAAQAATPTAVKADPNTKPPAHGKAPHGGDADAHTKKKGKADAAAKKDATKNAKTTDAAATKTGDGEQATAAVTGDTGQATAGGDTATNAVATTADTAKTAQAVAVGTAAAATVASDKTATSSGDVRASKEAATAAASTKNQGAEQANKTQAATGAAAVNAASEAAATDVTPTTEAKNDTPKGEKGATSTTNALNAAIEAAAANAVPFATTTPAATATDGTTVAEVQSTVTVADKSDKAQPQADSSAAANADPNKSQPATGQADRAPVVGQNRSFRFDDVGRTSTSSTDGGTSLSQADRARLVQRVARAVQTAEERGGELKLRLSPPELGSLKLEVQIRDGALSARIEAQTPEAKQVLIDSLPALREKLSEQNLRVEKFDVDLSNSGQQQGSPQMPDRQFEQAFRPAPRNMGGDVRQQPTSVAATTVDTGPAAASGDGGLNIVV
jgi:flagellar hook-length control protein FliK